MNQLIIGNSLFGSEAARLLTSNEATLEGYAIKHMFDHCDSIMKNVIDKKTKMKRQWLINDLLLLFIKKYVAVSLYFKFKKSFLWPTENSNVHLVMNCFSLKAKNAMISRNSKLLEIYDSDASEP